MTRPQDWSALGWGSDPVPGDPGTVATVAGKYRTTADAVSQASANLARLDMSENKSLGLATVLDQIKAVRTQLDDVESRVDGASAALEYYGPRLGEAQRLSLEALSEAEVARDAARSSERHRDDAASDYYGTNDTAQREAAKQRYDNYNQRVTAENQDLESAKAKLRRAIEERDAAAKTATDALQSIDQSSPVHDTFGDYFNEAVNKLIDFWDKYVAPWLDNVCDILDMASLLLSVAALVLTFTGVGAPVAAALFAISKGITLITTIAKGVKLAVSALKLIEGRTTWGDLGKDALMFGVGLLLSRGVKAASTKLIAGEFSKSTLTIDALEKVVKSGAYRSAVDLTEKAIEMPLKKIEGLARDAMGHDSPGAGTPVMNSYRKQVCGVSV